ANGLRVASRAASFAYKGRHVDPRDAASALHVDAIVTGSVRRAGDQLRIEAQLVDKKGGSPRWSQRFDRSTDDAFAVQDEIARAAARRRVGAAARLARPPGQTHWAYGLALIAWEPPGAVSQLEQVRARIGAKAPQITHLGVAYGLLGRPDSTRRIIAELLLRS